MAEIKNLIPQNKVLTWDEIKKAYDIAKTLGFISDWVEEKISEAEADETEKKEVATQIFNYLCAEYWS